MHNVEQPRAYLINCCECVCVHVCVHVSMCVCLYARMCVCVCVALYALHTVILGHNYYCQQYLHAQLPQRT